MRRLTILVDQKGWCAENRAHGIAKYAAPGWDVSIVRWESCRLRDPIRRNGPPHIVLLLVPVGVRELRTLLQDQCPAALLVTCFNTGWPRYREHFETAHAFSDATVINSLQCWRQSGRRPNTYYIPNGIDGSVFQIAVPPADRRPKALWCAGISGTNSARAEVKGHQLALSVAETLNGRGIGSEIVAVDPHGDTCRSREEIVSWYNSGTVLFVSSSSEGVPNVAIEAAACGCAIVSTRVGCMPEFICHEANGFLVDRTVNAISHGILTASRHYLEMQQWISRQSAAWDWKYRSKEYYQLFDSLLVNTRAVT